MSSPPAFKKPRREATGRDASLSPEPFPLPDAIYPKAGFHVECVWTEEESRLVVTQRGTRYRDTETGPLLATVRLPPLASDNPASVRDIRNAVKHSFAEGTSAEAARAFEASFRKSPEEATSKLALELTLHVHPTTSSESMQEVPPGSDFTVSSPAVLCARYVHAAMRVAIDTSVTPALIESLPARIAALQRAA
ncbi:MAG: hypothetical protein ACPGR8_11805 [Limisphaerales bacterium]